MRVTHKKDFWLNFILILISVIVVLSVGILQYQEKAASTPHMDAQGIFQLHNQERKKYNLKPYIYSVELEQSAQKKADIMAVEQRVEHIDNTGKHGYEYIESELCKFERSENITGNFSNEAAVQQWMDSPKHREAVLDMNYKYMGVGINGMYVAVHFCY